MQPKMQRDPGAEALAEFLPYTSRHPLILPKGLSDSHGKKYMLCTYPSPKEKTLK